LPPCARTAGEITTDFWAHSGARVAAGIGGAAGPHSGTAGRSATVTGWAAVAMGVTAGIGNSGAGFSEAIQFFLPLRVSGRRLRWIPMALDIRSIWRGASAEWRKISDN